MGKKLGQLASSEVSNNNDKKQFNNWIKVLRPKVYITDTSSFKKLVQELTGNGTAVSKLQTVEKSTVPSSISEDHKDQPESSLETSLDSSSESNQNQVSFPEEELNDLSYNRLIYLDDTTSPDDLLWNMNQERDYKLAWEDLESSLLPDIDRYPFCRSNYSQILQEVYGLEEICCATLDTWKKSAAQHLTHCITLSKDNEYRIPLNLVQEKKMSKTNKQRNWLEHKWSPVVVAASLIATMASQAGISLPGGVLQDDLQETTMSESSNWAGRSIMADTYPRRYTAYVIYNTTGFPASISVILLLISGLLFRRR
ncbi:conserved hypothetical protein [Ricinus communis]|uniref:VQ domain-containing protein n=1 Tax=Ricinus communis TaxID=3988 RepID=B9RQU0_RICCO|nr:conserved hypothetical protein [Ricinus communis]